MVVAVAAKLVPSVGLGHQVYMGRVSGHWQFGDDEEAFYETWVRVSISDMSMFSYLYYGWL